MVKSEVTVNLFRLLLHIGLFWGGGMGRGKDYIFDGVHARKTRNRSNIFDSRNGSSLELSMDGCQVTIHIFN